MPRAGVERVPRSSHVAVPARGQVERPAGVAVDPMVPRQIQKFKFGMRMLRTPPPKKKEKRKPLFQVEGVKFQEIGRNSNTSNAECEFQLIAASFMFPT